MKVQWKLNKIFNLRLKNGSNLIYRFIIVNNTQSEIVYWIRFGEAQ